MKGTEKKRKQGKTMGGEREEKGEKIREKPLKKTNRRNQGKKREEK